MFFVQAFHSRAKADCEYQAVCLESFSAPKVASRNRIVPNTKLAVPLASIICRLNTTWHPVSGQQIQGLGENSDRLWRSSLSWP
jgi:hypothetical protein